MGIVPLPAGCENSADDPRDTLQAAQDRVLRLPARTWVDRCVLGSLRNPIFVTFLLNEDTAHDLAGSGLWHLWDHDDTSQLFMWRNPFRDKLHNLLRRDLTLENDISHRNLTRFFIRARHDCRIRDSRMREQERFQL